MSEHVTRLAQAEEFARQGNVAAALAAAEQALSVDDKDAHTHCLLAALMLDEGFNEPAVAAAARAIEIDTQCAAAYLVLGLAYDRIGGMGDRSVLVWHELAEVAPDLAIAYVQLGEALYSAALHDEAVSAWERALELDPRDSRATYLLAIAAQSRQGTGAALAGFRRAAEFDLGQDEFFFALAGFERLAPPPAALDIAHIGPGAAKRLEVAYAFAAHEEYLKAAELIRAVLSESPDTVSALALAAYLYLKQDAINEATACALRAVALDGSDAAAIYALGMTLARRPALAHHATRLFSTLAEIAPSHTMSFVLLAESELALQHYAAAGDAYDRAIALDPGSVRALFGKAVVSLTQGDHSSAKWALGRAARFDIERAGCFWALYDGMAKGACQQ
ncbi:MAG: tetratricopeptide repeat protein [Coriobacteriia bacterium]|jgi:superkiller protein 3|nr:tetratricopeptide repeat protein [Coriobacteriia bacterium]